MFKPCQGAMVQCNVMKTTDIHAVPSTNKLPSQPSWYNTCFSKYVGTPQPWNMFMVYLKVRWYLDVVVNLPKPETLNTSHCPNPHHLRKFLNECECSELHALLLFLSVNEKDGIDRRKGNTRKTTPPFEGNPVASNSK